MDITILGQTDGRKTHKMLDVETGTSFAWTIIGHQQAGNTYTIVDSMIKMLLSRDNLFKNDIKYLYCFVSFCHFMTL